MKKKEFNLLLANTNRSVDYVNYLKTKNLKPKKIIIYSKSKVKKKLIINSFFNNIILFKTNDINNNKLVNYLLNLKEYYFIFSGYPAKIIKSSILLDKKFIIHSHPGKLPEYKGSTTIIYSIIKQNKIWCSTIRMNEKIDGGKILILKKYFFNKSIFKNFDKFDNTIRIKNICHLIKKNFNFNNQMKSKNSNNNYYYVAHPVMRVLANLKI